MQAIRILLCSAILLLPPARAVASDIADAAMNGDEARVLGLIEQGVDVDAPQVDGATALHWAVRDDHLDLARRLIEAGADVSAANRTGATPLELAVINGDPEMLELLLESGADANAEMTITGDTALMLAARTGVAEAVEVLLDHGADIDAREPWGGTTALMWAVDQGHLEVVRLLIDRGAEVNAQSLFFPPDTTRGFEGSAPRERREDEVGPIQQASGELTPLMFAAREGHLEVARLLIEAGASLDMRAADGKDALGLSIFNGHYDLASLLIESGAPVNQADARGFTPLFWAVDRRNMETAPNFPWLVTEDPLPLIRQLLEAGADPNKIVNDTPRARMRGGSPRIVFATPLMRAAFSGDLELVQLLLDYGADPHVRSSDNETVLSAAASTGFVPGYHKDRGPEERLEVIKLLVEEYGLDVNWHDDYGITPLMVAANLGDVPIIQYLIDRGARLDDHDLGKKNDGAFGASIEPPMPIDYAIGVGTFRPNNAIVFNEEAYNLMKRLMDERGIPHITSECTLRGFTCSSVDMDPRTATPAKIAEARRRQTGHQVEELSENTGLQVEKEDACSLDVNLPFGERADVPEECQKEEE